MSKATLSATEGVLHCMAQGKGYSCLWDPSASPDAWAERQNLELHGVTDFPDVFAVSGGVAALKDVQNDFDAMAKKTDDAKKIGVNLKDQKADWYYKDDNVDGESCHKLRYPTPQAFVVVKHAEEPDWRGNDILNADVTVSFTVRGKEYDYSFYEGLPKCDNPFSQKDETLPDFAMKPENNGAMNTSMQTAKDKEALAHADDTGPWWFYDGTTTNTKCFRSKISPMQDAKNAQIKGARNIVIHGDSQQDSNYTVVEYTFNGKSFFNDYSKKKNCGW